MFCVAFVGRNVLGIPSKGALPISEGCARNKSLQHSFFPIFIAASAVFVGAYQVPKGRIINVQAIRQILQRKWLGTSHFGRPGSPPHGFFAQEQHFRHALVEMFAVGNRVQRRTLQVSLGLRDVPKTVHGLRERFLRMPRRVKGAREHHDCCVKLLLSVQQATMERLVLPQEPARNKGTPNGRRASRNCFQALPKNARSGTLARTANVLFSLSACNTKEGRKLESTLLSLSLLFSPQQSQEAKEERSHTAVWLVPQTIVSRRSFRKGVKTEKGGKPSVLVVACVGRRGWDLF